MKPIVCMIEDDPLKRSLALFTHTEDFKDDFDLRFILCEQQFCDLLDEKLGSSQHFTLKQGDDRWVPIWNPPKDGFPVVFTVDMMVCWDDKDYRSGTPQPVDLPENGAGLRMGKRLAELRSNHNFHLIFWTAIDCRDISEVLEGDYGGTLLYKDDVRLKRLFEFIKTKLKH